MPMMKATAALLLAAGPTAVSAYNNGLGATPPMGWNTWCTDDLCGILDRCTESEVMSVADALVNSGMKDLGYEYVNLDDCWADKERDADGRLQPQPQQFPSGMPALADYVHSLGLKLGLYTCVGTETCKKGRPGSYGNFDVDAQTFADWGIDQVKADYCNTAPNTTATQLYHDFSAELNATGHPMLFSLCEWGEEEVWEWGADVGQMYRVQSDHLPLWHWPQTAAGEGYGQGVRDIIEWMGTLQPSKWAKPYGWMDPDFLMTLMLENVTLGDSGWTTMDFVDSRTEFSFWSMWSSPLVVATDPRNMSEAKRSILFNTEVIAIDQDPLFVAGDRIINGTDGGQVWSRPLANGDVAVLLYNCNYAGDDVDVSFTWANLGLPQGTVESMRDLWLHEDIAPTDPATGHTASLAPHDVQMLRFSPPTAAVAA